MQLGQRKDAPCLDGEIAGPTPRAMACAAIAVMLIYGLSLSGVWWAGPDSALYMGLGRSLAEGHGFSFNGSVSTNVTPGLPLLLAGLRLAFGASCWGPNLVMALSALACIFAVFRMVACLSDKATALAVALATAFSYRFLNHAQRVLTNVPFCALFWLCLLGSVRSGQKSPW